ncbi:MAG TPA: prevent-host-death protein [Ignavibacteriales bacterium]|jgi:prevent-host-death family protein|nr:prevent-host-death protein [Ignavibacteriales bacterium]
MKLSESVRPISYLKTHASEVIRDVSENYKTILITHNGEAKAILQDVKVYEKQQETLAMLKLLALSTKSIKEGKVKSLQKTFKDLDKKIKEFKKLKNDLQS